MEGYVDWGQGCAFGQDN